MNVCVCVRWKSRCYSIMYKKMKRNTLYHPNGMLCAASFQHFALAFFGLRNAKKAEDKGNINKLNEFLIW